MGEHKNNSISSYSTLLIILPLTTIKKIKCFLYSQGIGCITFLFNTLFIISKTWEQNDLVIKTF